MFTIDGFLKFCLSRNVMQVVILLMAHIDIGLCGSLVF